MNVHVIINPAAGREEAVLFKMNAFFQQYEIDYSVAVTTRKINAGELTRRALADGVDAVVGYGGDGTLMQIANALREKPTPLLVVPGGTANVLSQELRVPPSIPKALSLLLPEYGRVNQIDMAWYKDACFLETLGVGIPAKWVQEADRELKNKYGLLSYIAAGVRATLKSKSTNYTLTLDGRTVKTRGIACLVTNSGSTGLRGLRLAKEISIADGILDVLVFKLKFFENLYSRSDDDLFDLKQNKKLLFEHFRAREISVQAEPPQPVMVDGEMADSTPVQVRIAPHALNIYRPTEKALTLWDRIVGSLSDEEEPLV